jgi:hypothetical protein
MGHSAPDGATAVLCRLAWGIKFPACLITLSDPFENTDFTHMADDRLRGIRPKADCHAIEVRRSPQPEFWTYRQIL